MVGNGSESRVEALKRRRDQLNAKLVLARAEERRKARTEDTRRKILLGAWVLSNGAGDADLTEEKLRQHMDGFLVRSQDRALFRLPPREAPSSQASGETAGATSSQPSDGGAADPQSQSD